MPVDTESKAYVRKHRLNDLLNELFAALTQSKPDNPVEFAIKHFEAKLPSPPHSPAAAQKKNEPTKITSGADNDEQATTTGNDVLSKLFARKNLLNIADAPVVAAKQDVGAVALTSTNLLPFSNLAIMNKINKIMVKTANEKTPEQLLDAEFIHYVDKRGGVADDSEHRATAKLTNAYKSSVRLRDSQQRVKHNLRDLIAQERDKLVQPEGTTESSENESRVTLAAAANDADEQERLLSDEIPGCGGIHKRSMASRADKADRSDHEPVVRMVDAACPITPMSALGVESGGGGTTPRVVQLVICQQCSRVITAQNSSNIVFGEPQLAAAAIQQTSNQEPMPFSSPTPLPRFDDDNDGANFFELLTKSLRATSQEAQLQARSQEAQLDRKSAPTAGNVLASARPTESFEDIESASQVSGPRTITPYEAPTSRRSVTAENREPTRPAATTATKENSVMEWILARQQQTQPSPTEAFGIPFLTPTALMSEKAKSSKAVSSRTVSAVGAQTLNNSAEPVVEQRNERSRSSQVSNATATNRSEQQQQQWKAVADSSSSEVSKTRRNNKPI